jgi:hypothetical protein
MPLAVEPYQAACIALDATASSAYVSDPFESDCATQVDACRRQVTDKWAEFLKKEGLAQSPDAIRRCEMFKEGSRPGQSPRSRVRQWRDEEVAQAQAARPNKYARVVPTTFEPK